MAPLASYLKGNVMLRKGCPLGFMNVVERILEWVWVSSRREKEGNGMATIIYWAPAMGRLYARDMTTKVFNLSTRYMQGLSRDVRKGSCPMVLTTKLRLSEVKQLYEHFKFIINWQSGWYQFQIPHHLSLCSICCKMIKPGPFVRTTFSTYSEVHTDSSW